eukprot:scaffold52890_cov105-Attheya_sp.AAC.1
MEPHPAREWIHMTPMDIITDDGSYGTTPSQGMDPDDTPMDIITDGGSYGTPPRQGVDPDDTNGHR